MKRFIRYVLEEGPTLSRKERLHAIGWSSVYFYFFLLFFQPFGVNNYDPSEKITLTLVIALGIFIGGSTLILVLNEYIFYPLVKPVRRIAQVGWFIWNYFILSTSCFIIYNILGEWHDFNWASYREFLVNFAALCSLPFAAILVYLSNRSLKKSLSAAYQYRGKSVIPNDTIRILAENEKDALVIKIQNILYMESSDNYVDVYFMEDGKKVKTMLRQSLKGIEEQALHPALFRCHRSYIINLLHVDRIEGNRNKLVVKLSQNASSFPVARTVIDALLEKIEK